ncbi:hypothetical protein OGAPHI_003759 [Ogataea philodendri]|uniref:WD repeat-containing protein JIP5 n=1 Tax=Ogataea philodendri TaxID=1378263 RepID=A0A9P8P5D3_9ASCO|nr:uncharacterized protein OGAPHI_003759 [Ogataea philodendri]KAH3665572.1 hypothetical protein OGAPHI_003759 [Ogataea philodendri]
MVKSVAQSLVDFNFNSDPLFSFAAHPTENVLVVGSGTGQVKLMKVDVEKLQDQLAKSSDGLPAQYDVKPKELDGPDAVTLGWRTKRHQGSCRSIIFDAKGEHVYSAGLDRQIKKAKTETGAVVAKSAILDSNITELVAAPNKNFLIVGTEDGDLVCLDSNTLKQMYHIPKVHEDAISSLNHFVPKSDYQFVSTGSTTLAHVDIRKEQPLQQSDDQEDELLSSGWLDPTNPNTMLCGMSEGVVTVWKPEMNKFADQISRIRINREPVESVISALDTDGDFFWAGSFDGTVAKVNSRLGKVVERRIHSETDEVSFLDIDNEYRLISGGMDKLTIWQEGEQGNDDEEDEEDEEEWTGFSGDDSDASLDSLSDSESAESAESSASEDSDSDDEKPAVPLADIKDKLLARLEDSDDEEPPKKRKKPVKQKQQKQQAQEHGIRKFDGL